MKNKEKKIIDFSKSYITMNSIKKYYKKLNKTTFNPDIIHRFHIESILEYDGKVFYQCAMCRAENTLFTEGNFFQEKNYRFLPVFTDDDVIIFRKHVFAEPRPYRTTYSTHEQKNWLITLEEHKNFQKLETGKMVADAVKDNMVLVGKTIIGKTVLHYPIKSININAKNEFQVDTGIVIFPSDNDICLGFIIFNNWSYAEVLLEKPFKTGLFKKVMHYSECISIDNVVNELYGVEALKLPITHH